MFNLMVKWLFPYKQPFSFTIIWSYCKILQKTIQHNCFFCIIYLISCNKLILPWTVHPNTYMTWLVLKKKINIKKYILKILSYFSNSSKVVERITLKNCIITFGTLVILFKVILQFKPKTRIKLQRFYCFVSFFLNNWIFVDHIMSKLMTSFF